MLKPDTEVTDLFASDNAPPSLDAQRVFVLTNRNNILDFLSSGMITPAAGVDKYYADVSAESPGRVPVFGSRVPYSSRLEETPTSFPVAIELDLSKLSATPLPAFSESKVASSAAVGLPGIRAWAPAGVIPTSAAIAIHFRSDVEKSEYQARDFANIPDLPIPLLVSRELFADEDDFVKTILAWLGSLPDPQPEIGAQLRALDREAGALALVARVIRGTPEDLRDFGQLMLAQVNTTSATNLAGKRPKRPKRTPGASQSPSKGGLPVWLKSQAIENGKTAADGAEAVVFHAAAEVFRDANIREAWRPLEKLNVIEATALARLSDDEAKAEVTRNFEAIRGVVRLDREFRPLDTGKGLEAAKAILMVLLRPEPTTLLSWERAESGASDQVLAGAVYLNGMLNGHKRLPVSLRSPNLDSFLASRAAARLALSETIWPVPSESDIQVKAKSEGDGGNSTLYINNVEVLTKRQPPISSAEKLQLLDPKKAESQQLLVEVVSALGWADCLESVVQFNGDEVSVAHNKKNKSISVTGPGVATISVRLKVGAWERRLLEDGIPVNQERVIGQLLAKTTMQQPTERTTTLAKGTGRS